MTKVISGSIIDKYDFLFYILVNITKFFSRHYDGLFYI